MDLNHMYMYSKLNFESLIKVTTDFNHQPCLYLYTN